MSADRLDEIKARADAATEGPWLQDGPWWTDDGGSEPTALPCVVDADRALVVFPPDATDVGMKRPEDRDANMAFIAAAREDVPWLLALVESLTAERDALAAQVARVEKLAGQWARLAGTAINPDSREWLQACSETLRECLSGWQKMHAALADTETDTTDVDVCSGDADCTSELHVHGCFADTAGPCTDPDEHQPTDQEVK